MAEEINDKDEAVKTLKETIEKVQRVRDDIGDEGGHFAAAINELRRALVNLRKLEPAGGG